MESRLTRVLNSSYDLIEGMPMFVLEEERLQNGVDGLVMGGDEGDRAVMKCARALWKVAQFRHNTCRFLLQACVSSLLNSSHTFDHWQMLLQTRDQSKERRVQLDHRNLGSIRIDRRTFGEQLLCDLWEVDDDVMLAEDGDVDQVDGVKLGV